MKISAFLHKMSFFKRMLVSNLLMIFVMISVSFALYSVILNNEIDEAISSNERILVQMKDSIDIVLREINDQVVEQSLNNQLFEIMNFNLKVNESNLSKISSCMKALPRVTLNNEYIKAYYLYSRRNELIVMPSAVFLRLPLYYEPLFQFGDLTYDEWKTEILCQEYYGKLLPSRMVSVNGSKSRCIPYLYTYRSEVSFQPSGKFVFLLNENSILKLMDQARLNGAEYSCLFDEENDVVLSNGSTAWIDQINQMMKNEQITQHISEFTVSGEKVIAIKSQSGIFNYSCLSVVPYSEIYQQDNVVSARILLFSAVFIMFLIGVLLAYVMAVNSYRPLKNIMNSHNILKNSANQATDRNEISLIDQTITKLKDNQNFLQKNINSQRIWMKDVFFSQLIDGSIDIHGDIEKSLAAIGVELEFVQCYGVVISYRNYMRKSTTMSEAYNYQLLFEHVLCELTDIVPFYKMVNENMMYALYIDNGDDIFNFFRDLYDRMVNDYGIEMIVFIGTPQSNLSYVNQSFTEAKNLSLSADLSGGQHIFYCETETRQRVTLVFMPEQTRRIIDYCLSANNDNARHEIEKIRSNVLGMHNLSKFHIQIIVSDIISLVHKIWNSLPGEVPDDIKRSVEKGAEEPLRMLSVHHAYVYLLRCIDLFCAYIEENQKRSNNAKLEKIKNYIDENYMDPGISLCSVSSIFSMTEHYLSDFFKKQTGINFSTYVESVRISQAQVMLEHGISINEIAERVGYINTNTFRRAYRRRLGHNPNIDKKE